MNQYAEISTSNHGSYGTVQLVRQSRTSRMYAAKRVSSASSSRKEVDDEIAVHTRVNRHARVAQLVDHFYDADTNEHVSIVEYCSGGDSHDAIARSEKSRPSEIKKIISQSLDTLEFCHSVGVYHRDIKPENIFSQHNGNIKLGDWGLATRERRCRDFGTGSDHYMAPECFDRAAECYDAAQADIWAAGVVSLNMSFGRTPFKQATERDPSFKDYAYSRESSFDIFPTSTRDVFSALRHSLASTPENRSIAKMRAAVLAIRNWTTDDELEQMHELEQSREKSLVSGGERSPARQVPVVHQPFRVPTAVARSLHTPTHNWDRRKSFTPPTTTTSAPAFSRSRPHSYKWSMHSPRHLEQPDEEDTLSAPTAAPRGASSSRKSVVSGPLDEEDDDLATKELDRPSSPSSTSSTSSASSFTNPKSDALDGMFSMDDETLEHGASASLAISEPPYRYRRYY